MPAVEGYLGTSVPEVTAQPESLGRPRCLLARVGYPFVGEYLSRVRDALPVWIAEAPTNRKLSPTGIVGPTSTSCWRCRSYSSPGVDRVETRRQFEDYPGVSEPEVMLQPESLYQPGYRWPV